MKKRRFINSTIGMCVYHDKLRESKLVRVEFYENESGEVVLIAVSGHNLAPFRSIKHVTISKEEFSDRPFDYYDDAVEFYWAINLLGFER